MFCAFWAFFQTWSFGLYGLYGLVRSSLIWVLQHPFTMFKCFLSPFQTCPSWPFWSSWPLWPLHCFIWGLNQSFRAIFWTCSDEDELPLIDRLCSADGKNGTWGWASAFGCTTRMRTAVSAVREWTLCEQTTNRRMDMPTWPISRCYLPYVNSF